MTVTEQEYEYVWRECRRYEHSHPGLMVSFSNTFIKERDIFRKVFWVAIGIEPWPWQMLATRAETQSDMPREAFEKAVALAEIRAAAHAQDSGARYE